MHDLAQWKFQQLDYCENDFSSADWLWISSDGKAHWMKSFQEKLSRLESDLKGLTYDL